MVKGNRFIRKWWAKQKGISNGPFDSVGLYRWVGGWSNVQYIREVVKTCNHLTRRLTEYPPLVCGGNFRWRPKPASLLQRHLREHRRETGGHCRRRLVARQAEHEFRAEPVVRTVGMVSNEQLIRCWQHLRYQNLGVGNSRCLLKDSDCTETFEVTWYRLIGGLVRDKEPPWQLQFSSKPVQGPYLGKRARILIPEPIRG